MSASLAEISASYWSSSCWLALPALSLLGSAAVTQGDIQNIKDELTDIKEQKKAAEDRLAAIRDDLSKAKEQMELIQGQVVLTESQINASQQLLDQYDADISAKERGHQHRQQQGRRQHNDYDPLCFFIHIAPPVPDLAGRRSPS
mgnify:CR=1 FL=1